MDIGLDDVGRVVPEHDAVPLWDFFGGAILVAHKLVGDHRQIGDLAPVVEGLDHWFVGAIAD